MTWSLLCMVALFMGENGGESVVAVVAVARGSGVEAWKT
jgi:hypothetical protein